MKMNGGVMVQLHAFLTPTLDGGEWSLHTLPSTHWTGDWVGLSWSRHGGKEKNTCLCWEMNPGHSACSQDTIKIIIFFLAIYRPTYHFFTYI